jgi:hypothetical protein
MQTNCLKPRHVTEQLLHIPQLSPRLALYSLLNPKLYRKGKNDTKNMSTLSILLNKTQKLRQDVNDHHYLQEFNMQYGKKLLITLLALFCQKA